MSKTNNKTFDAKFELENLKDGLSNDRTTKLKYETELYNATKFYGGRSRSIRVKFLHWQ